MHEKSSITYLPYVDGLRGLAVFIILLFHLDVSVFKGGFIGVDIFFVISGYLITSIITREIQAGEFSFANFYARRIRRIFPALFVMLFFASIGAVFFLGLSEYSDFFKALRYTSGQISNIFFAREVDYFAQGNAQSPLLHTWSLGVEEQFYLVWPILLIAVHKFWGLQRSLIILIALFVVSLGISEYLVRHDAMQAFYYLHSRAWQLAMGGIVALNILPVLSKRGWVEIAAAIGLLLIVVPALCYDETYFPGLKALVPCLGAALFIYAAKSSQGWGHKLLSLPPIVFTGLISYSLYLWHWPLIAFYKGYFNDTLSLAVQASIFAISFVLAFLSYKFVEQPFRRSKASSRKTIVIGVLMIVTSILLSNVLKNYSDAGWRVTYETAEYARDPHELDKVCSVLNGAFDKDHCIVGPNKDAYEVILVGDSHASHYTPTVLAWAKEKGLTVRIFLRGACRTWIETKDLRVRNGKVDQYCMDLTKAFYETIQNDKSIRYVFLGAYMPKDDADVRHSLEKIKAYGGGVYYLGQVPIFKNNAHQCMIRNHLLITKWFPREDSGGDCMALDHEYSKSVTDKEMKGFRPLLKTMGIPYFDPIPFLQTAIDDQGRFLYLDANHINRYSADKLAPHLADFMDKLPEPIRKPAP